jgi:tRNA threonylcarbamoyl adenosine modification protein YeaZ
MKNILVIETSTERSIISIVTEQNLLYVHYFPIGFKQSQLLLPELQKALSETRLSVKNFDLIVAGTGPGSYTGIRVGVSVAQALAFSQQIPLVGVSSLYGFPSECDGSFLSIIDAKMGGAYVLSGFKKGAQIGYDTEPTLLPLEDIVKKWKDQEIDCITPLQQNLLEKIKELDSTLSWDWIEKAPSPLQMALSGIESYQRGNNFCNTHLPISYLRKTQAEIEKELSKKATI